MEFNQGSHVLPSLLSMLNNKPESILSAVNATSIELICKLLCREDYVSLAEQLSQESDVKNLLDFILHLLRLRLLPSPDETVGIYRRARRLMLKIVARMPAIPWSLIITGISLPEKRDYIGSGGFGRVFKGELQGAVVPLKVLYKSDNNVAFCREALMWRSLTHRFVLPFLGIHELRDGTTPQFFLVSPYMTNGTLAQWRKAANPSVAQIEERILQVAQGMEYIHSEGAVHGDLRGENILLDANLHVQIADFGLTRLSEATNTRSGALHLNFAAPELFGFSEDEDDSSDDVPARTQMTDVYAFGCLYYEIHFNSVPFAGKTDLQIFTLISRGTLPLRLDEPPLTDDAWKVIRCCWNREPWQRPRMKDVMMVIMGQDPFQNLLELCKIAPGTLAILTQGLGLGNRRPAQMSPAERALLLVAYNKQEVSAPLPPFSEVFQQPGRGQKRSRGAALEEQRGVGWTDWSPPQKRRRPSLEQPHIETTGSQGDLSSIHGPAIDLDIHPLAKGYQHPQGHANQLDVTVKKHLAHHQRKNRKSEGLASQALKKMAHDPTNSAVQSSSIHPGTPNPHIPPAIIFGERTFAQWFDGGNRSLPQALSNSITQRSANPNLHRTFPAKTERTNAPKLTQGEIELTGIDFGRDFEQWFNDEVPASSTKEQNSCNNQNQPEFLSIPGFLI